MPEAVASNSIPVSDRQPREGWRDHFAKKFDQIECMLKAFNEMRDAAFDTCEVNTSLSYGVHLIHGMIMDRLTAVSQEVDRVFAQREGQQEQGLNPALMERIGQFVSNAFHEARPGLAEDAFNSWPEPDKADYFAACSRYYNLITTKAGGSADLLEVGSLLPWLELKARHDLIGEEPAISDDANSLRDRLIAQQAKDGVAAAEISQAFNLRRGAVERIIARLTVEEEVGRKAV